MNYENEHYVALFINGKEAPSSACFSGTKAACKLVADRMNCVKSKPTWRVVPCVGAAKGSK